MTTFTNNKGIELQPKPKTGLVHCSGCWHTSSLICYWKDVEGHRRSCASAIGKDRILRPVITQATTSDEKTEYVKFTTK